MCIIATLYLKSSLENEDSTKRDVPSVREEMLLTIPGFSVIHADNKLAVTTTTSFK